MQPISQTFKGVIPPVRIDHTNGDGQIVPIVDWNAIAQKHTPPGAINIQVELVLEYLTCTHYLPTLLRVPAAQYPQFSAVDGDAIRGAKLTEFKRKWSPADNYAVQFLLWNWWNGTWREQHFDRDYIQGQGLEGRINLIKPFLVTAGDTVFGDRLHKLGMSIAPRFLRFEDSLEISGGYSGSISYLYKEPEIILQEGQAGSMDVGSSPQSIVSSSSKRAALYVCNAGKNRVFWRFTNQFSTLLSKEAPFLDPGESLTYEHGQLFYSGKNDHHLLKNQINSICRLSLYAMAETGTNKITYQELIYP